MTAIHGDDVENRIIQRLYREMDLHGSLDVIRNGFFYGLVRAQKTCHMSNNGIYFILCIVLNLIKTRALQI